MAEEVKYREGDEIQVTLSGIVKTVDPNGFPLRVVVGSPVGHSYNNVSFSLERTMNPEIKLIKRAIKTGVMYYDPWDNTTWWKIDDISCTWYSIRPGMCPFPVSEKDILPERFARFKEMIPEE